MTIFDKSVYWTLGQYRRMKRGQRVLRRELSWLDTRVGMDQDRRVASEDLSLERDMIRF